MSIGKFHHYIFIGDAPNFIHFEDHVQGGIHAMPSNGGFRTSTETCD
jgi:hypothetical protein